MVASGAVSLGRTKLPTLTLAALMRPEIGARIVVVVELDLEIFERGLVRFGGARATC